jgi:hypothetical protein
MDSKKVIEQLIKIADKQQKIIERLAQAVQLPGSGDVGISGGKDPGAVNPAPPAAHLVPQDAGKHDSDLILAALPPAVKPAVAKLEVVAPDVMVTFHPGKATQQAYDAVKQTVHGLQVANKLSGKTYNVRVA